MEIYLDLVGCDQFHWKIIITTIDKV